MIRVLGIATLALGLAGCVSPQQQARTDDRDCQGMGARPGTDVYVQCRMFKQQQRAQEDTAFRNRMAVLSTMYNTPAPRTINCTSHRMGTFTDTTCY